MILIRPADPDKPIRILNAVAVEMEQPPESWMSDSISYVIESVNVEIEADDE